MTRRGRIARAKSLPLALILTLLTAATNGVRSASDPVGCYLATPPLGSRPSDTVLDTAVAFFALDSGGTLRRPLLAAPRERTRGTWFTRSDSLFVTFSDGFTSESYRLRAMAANWAGTSDWITDEAGTPPVQRAAVWARVSCR